MMKRILFAILLAAAGANAWTQDGILLGMLEDVPGVYAGQGHSAKVRLLFAHQGSKWSAYPSECTTPQCLKTVIAQYPQEVRWFVGLNGRKLAEIVARTPPDGFRRDSHIGLQDIVSGTAPVIGKPSREFSGWLADEVRRPLIAVSKPHFKDPAHWKRVATTPRLQKQGVALLREHGLKVCKAGSSDAKPLVPLQYEARNLKIRAHRSNSGWLVMMIDIDMGAEEEIFPCDGGNENNGFLSTMTFAVDPSGKARFLGPGLMLVDAGDYDGDGRSELVLALSLYNRGGYVLFSGDFVEQARFVFSYH